MKNCAFLSPLWWVVLHEILRRVNELLPAALEDARRRAARPPDWFWEIISKVKVPLPLIILLILIFAK